VALSITRNSAPHSGQSSQLFADANDGNAQFLSTVARSALVRQPTHVPHRVAIRLRKPTVDNLRNFLLRPTTEMLSFLQPLGEAVLYGT
jgi:hypothetical protein